MAVLFPGLFPNKQKLLEEAAYQQNIVLQASQALNLCVANDITFRGSTEEIEAERVLLLASKYSYTIVTNADNYVSLKSLTRFCIERHRCHEPDCILLLLIR